MPDIRFNVEVLDDFDRVEDPIEPPWNEVTFGPGHLSLTGTNMVGINDAQAIYQPGDVGPFNLASESVEVWGQVGAGVDLSEALRIGFFTPGGVGYMLLTFNSAGTPQWNIRRYTGGGGQSTIDSVPHAFPFGSPNTYVLVQVVGGTLTTWLSEDNGDNWSGPVNTVAAADSGVYLMMGVSSDDGGNPSWMAMGGGVEEPFIPQIYRRPTE